MSKDDIKKAETRARLKAFLQNGHPDDVSSVLVHTLMHHAEKSAENTKDKTSKNNKKKK